ncbi:MAG TPA: hypothetical protein VGP79_06430 [Bryobacteraceae bacterium]|nr:hypothetical protein [Bryobacteraceae bacterium]
MPLRRVDESGRWEHAPRWPLIDLYFGVCRARQGEVIEAEEFIQRDLCNCGYPRGRCDRFPDDGASEAVRFSVVSEAEGMLRIIWVVEREHVPVEHRELEYVVASGAFVETPSSDILLAQARAFVESYLRLAQP